MEYLAWPSQHVILPDDYVWVISHQINVVDLIISLELHEETGYYAISQVASDTDTLRLP